LNTYIHAHIHTYIHTYIGPHVRATLVPSKTSETAVFNILFSHFSCYMIQIWAKVATV